MVNAIFLLLAANSQEILTLTRAVEFYANPATDSTKAVQGDTAKLWIPGYPDYTLGTFNENGKTYLPYAFWQHQPTIGDTFSIKAKVKRNGKVYETIVRAPFENEELIQALEGFLNNPNNSLPVHAANIRKFIDRTGSGDSTVTVISFNHKNPSLIDVVELPLNKGQHFYHAFNVETLDPQPGDSIRSEFILGNATVKLDWQVDKILGDAQLITDSLIFETTKARKKSELERKLCVWPTITTNRIVHTNSEGVKRIYDIYGRLVGIQDTRDIELPKKAGIYFIIDDGRKAKVVKP